VGKNQRKKKRESYHDGLLYDFCGKIRKLFLDGQIMTNFSVDLGQNLFRHPFYSFFVFQSDIVILIKINWKKKCFAKNTTTS